MKIHSSVGTNSTEIKSHNISAILLTLLHNENISRVYLANTLGVSNATITNLVTELSKQGLIIEKGLVPSDGQVGRPQKALQLVPDTRFAIGVHIDVGAVYIALSNLFGKIIDSVSFEHSLNDPAETVLKTSTTHILRLIESHADLKAQIVGIGVAASGLVDVEHGINRIAPNLKWYDVPIRDLLAQNLNYPIIVDNNVRAMAFGEALFGTATDINVLAFIYGRIGVGAGLVVNGQLYRGAGAGAGEIGHTLLICNNGKYQTLESLVSEPAILKLAKERTGQAFTFKELLQAARDGDAILLNLLDERAQFLGIAIANMVNILNPELIVLGGIFQQAQDLMLDTIRETVKQNAFANLGERVEIHVTPFANTAGMVGSAALALDAFFYRPQSYLKEA